MYMLVQIGCGQCSAQAFRANKGAHFRRSGDWESQRGHFPPQLTLRPNISRYDVFVTAHRYPAR